jgi:hypothetical protein
LLVIDNVPERVPDAVGVKVIVTSHPSPTFRTLGNEPQLLVSAKSPFIVMAERVTEALPVFAT